MDRVKLCFIGCGNLATQLASAFAPCATILQLYSRTEASAKALAEKVGAPYTTDIKALTRDADIYICALKDSAFDEVLSKGDFKNKLLVHTAGSMPMSVLASYTGRYGVIYPLQTFSKNKTVDFAEIPLFIEACDGQTLDYLHSVANLISGKVYCVNSEVRGKLHLSAVFASNFSNHMYALAYELLNGSGLPFEVLLPLIDETARKVHSLPPKEAQTGPAVRYDTNVIDKHLKMLADDPQLADIYKLISTDIHERG